MYNVDTEIHTFDRTLPTDEGGLTMKNSRHYYLQAARENGVPVYEATADRAGLMVGSADCHFLIYKDNPEDGNVWVIVDADRKLEIPTIPLLTVIDGEFSIYDYDCPGAVIGNATVGSAIVGGEILTSLAGEWYVYGDGDVVIFQAS